MGLEQELKEKIKQAREQAITEQEPVVEEVAQEPVKEETVVEEKIKETQDAGEVKEKDAVEDEYEEDDEDLEDDLEIEPDTDEYKKLDSQGKKFSHMRKEGKDKDRKIQELAERLARMEGAQSAKQEPVAAPKEEEVVPNKEFEPEAWMDYQLKKRDDTIAGLSKKIEVNEQQTASQKGEIAYKSLEGEHCEKDPSYMEAKKFLIEKNIREIRELYPSAAQADIEAHVKNEEYKLVESMSKNGIHSDVIFSTIKNMAIDGGYKEIVPKKRDKTKLKDNIRKSANLNDAPSGGEDIGYSNSQMARMKSADFHKLTANPKEMKKAMAALKLARIKASA